jgi:3,4-dihydroxy 2-butanone 4-phosphate synthase / GTP cyclohydrolase II
MIDQLIKGVLKDLQQGKMALLLDPSDRENEGDLVLAAEAVTADHINFMMTKARGIICLAMSQSHFDRLNIPMMTSRNRSLQQTPFGISFEAATGITTGVSAADRARTIAVAADPQSSASDIVMPGHVFPLRAKKHGVLQRLGHTEGSVDLMRLAGLEQAAVICEIANDDGSMAGPQELIAFAKAHDIKICSIQDIVDYRQRHENHLERMAVSQLPTKKYGVFDIQVFANTITEKELVVLTKPATSGQPPLVRLHSACFTGDVLGSLRCDCGEQLDEALAKITAEGGALVYLHQEGRGIGLLNKIKAYALQDQGLDTVEANLKLGFPADSRQYANAAHLLQHLDYDQVRLMTNNPCKVTALESYGIRVKARVPLEIKANSHNERYLKTKRDKLGHAILEELL